MTRKSASYFRGKNRKFFVGAASRLANWARVVGGDVRKRATRAAATDASTAKRSDGASEGGEAERPRRKGRRLIFWLVFLPSAALAFAAAERGASQCFWRRWRSARPVANARTYYAPPVVGYAPSSTVWAVPRTVAVARPTWTAPVVRSTFPSVPVASAAVCVPSAPLSTSVAYPSQVETSSTVADVVETTSVCANVGSICDATSACVDSSVCSPCDAASANACSPCVETEYKEEEITTYETVWDCETRFRDKTTTRQVPETSIKREKVKVERPVWETVEKETTYNVTRYVPETSTQTRTRTALRPVVQMRERKIVETVNQPVVETVMTQRSYVVNRPTTTYRTETRDYGAYETQITAVPGRERCCLRWRCGGDYWDPTTGRTRYRLPGLYWTPTQEPTEYRAQRVYRPNLVSTQVPVTTYAPQTVVENVPTTRTTYRPVQVERVVSEPTTVYVQETQTEQVPVTTYKPVTERVVKKTPTRVLRMQTTEEIRETPVTTYKTVTEVVKEPYVARVARKVPKKIKTLRPIYKTVEPVSTRYAAPPATNATFETQTTVSETTVEKTGCCEPATTTLETVERIESSETGGESWDAADVAPSLTKRSSGASGVWTTETNEAQVAGNQTLRKSGENATSPDLPSAVPSVRRAARPNSVASAPAPPVVSPSVGASTTAGERVGKAEGTSAALEESDATQTSSAFEFAEFDETFESADETNGVTSGEPSSEATEKASIPTVAPTRATGERR